MLQKVAMLQPWGTHHTCAWELPGLCLKGGLVRLFVRQAFFHILTHVSGCSGIFQKHVTYLCAIFILDADHEISKNHQCISKWIIEKSAEHQVCRFGRLSDSLKKESKKWETSAEYPVNPTTATHWKPRRVRNFKIQVSDLWNLTGLQRHEDWPFILRSPPPHKKRTSTGRGSAHNSTGCTQTNGSQNMSFTLFTQTKTKVACFWISWRRFSRNANPACDLNNIISLKYVGDMW